ncbi:MAG: fumarate hydratase, partial [Acetatifactor sp.]|nr:fumarate hydratase [Acetatifactor sp.]
MRTIAVDKITDNIKEMCIEANHFLSKDMKQALTDATAVEKSPLGRQILEQLQENLQ